MFIVCLVCCRAAEHECFNRLSFFRYFIGIVVFNFMVIPSYNPRECRMCSFKIGVRTVLSVTVPIVLQRNDFRAVVRADIACF